MTNALSRMRSLSKEIKDQRRSGLGNLQKTHQQDLDSKRTDEAGQLMPDGKSSDPISGGTVAISNEKPFKKDNFGDLLMKSNFRGGLNDSHDSRGNRENFEHG